MSPGTSARLGDMTTPYTHINLVEVEDAAPSFGLDHAQETRFAHAALEAERTGVTLQRIRPGARPGFAHRHEQAEEVYVVLSGSGRVKLDDDIVELGLRDAIRVAPSVTRSFEAGPDGLELLAVGAHHPNDGEAFFGWW
jgi:mannose-6-phosphate isomerase-like protein (cupin superfamily)